MGERVRQARKVRMVLSGHVHQGKYRVIERDDLGLPPFDTYTNPADYGEPAAMILNTETWMVEKLKPGF
jgi:UDP-2,3-diacylglucosamine pyrophosphatase LpxH